jgi:RND family efflux transporter MFP subunit
VRWPLILLLPGASLAGCSSDQPADAKKAAPATVAHPRAESDLATVRLSSEAVARLGIESVPAAEERLSGTRTLGGEIVVPEGRSVVVAAPVAGTLVAAGAARAGAPVEEGEAIFRLVPLVPAERDQRIEAERALSAAEAEEQAARQRLERLQQLLDDGAASVRAVEEARAQHEVLTAALSAARQRLSVVSLSPIGPQGEIAITAPFGGVLQSISAAPGQTVAASAPLFQLAQVSTLWVRVPVYAGEAAGLDPREPAAVTTLDTGGPPRLARRVQAPLRADPAGASVDLFFELPAGGRPLRPGERVSVQLSLAAEDSGLTIPYSAVVYDIHGATWVYEDLGEGAYARGRVEIARHVGDRVVVSRGLAPGTRVVTVGAAELFGTEFGAGK